MQATARIFILKAPAKRTLENLCPIKLCITYNRDRKYYSIQERIKESSWLYLSEEDYTKVTSDSPRGKYRDIAFEYRRIEDEAYDIIKDIPIFSFGQFEEKYFNRVGEWDNVFSAMWHHVQSLKQQERFGYASSFESTLRAIKEYHTGKEFEFVPRKDKVGQREKDYLTGRPLRFVDITGTWLRGFEKYLKDKEKSTSTIGIYMRNIRVLFNLAIDKHKIKAEYPFRDYTPKTATKRKIALTAHQISLISNYETDHPVMRFYRDMFMFSFLGNGMNLADIARLRYSNIKDGELCFVRQKTKEEAVEETLHVILTRSLQDIINRHGQKAVGFDAYIFPILKEEWTEVRKYAEIKQLTKQVNKYIREVAKDVGIEEKISSYSARHSWATILKHSGASVEFIKESLGHSSTAVTERYLKSFEKSTRKEQAEKMEALII